MSVCTYVRIGMYVCMHVRTVNVCKSTMHSSYLLRPNEPHNHAILVRAACGPKSHTTMQYWYMLRPKGPQNQVRVLNTCCLRPKEPHDHAILVHAASQRAAKPGSCAEFASVRAACGPKSHTTMQYWYMPRPKEPQNQVRVCICICK